MYKVLYRKYRPQRFADVVGQPQVTTTLINELKSQRISHAYLFNGTRGTGKTTCAKILSKAVNCLAPVEGDACGVCDVCRGVEEGSLLDVMEIDAASNNGVDSIRSLIEESNFTPVSAKYRVYIIDEVHMLTVAAFNALLKTLEEPPAHVVFILATTEVHRLPATILSRCQRFDFRRISPEDVAARLQYIAGQENVTLDEDAALLIARITDGTMRDAVSILDQCISRGSHITLELATMTAGVVNRDYLVSLGNAICDGETGEALELIDKLYKDAKDMNRLCEELTEYFRGLMLIKVMRRPENILTLSESELEEMGMQAKRMQISVITHSIGLLEDTQNKMRFSNARIELELTLVKLCNPELDSSPEALIRRLEKLEKKYLSSAEPSADAARPAQNISRYAESSAVKKDDALNSSRRSEGSTLDLENEKKTMSSVEMGESEQTASAKPAKAEISTENLSQGAELFTDWPEILETLKQYSSSVAAAFNGSAAYIKGEYLLIDAPQIAFELLKRQSQRDRMREAVKKATGKIYKLGPYKKPKHTDSQQQKADPLDELEKRAREAGIEITEIGGTE